MSAPDTTALTRAATEQRAPAPAPVPQYAVGFEGAAAAPFSPEAAAILAAPVVEEEVELRDDGIVFLPGVAYRRILTRAFGPGAWALVPRGPARREEKLVLFHGALFILGRYVSEAMGECETRWKMTYASSLEGARTDCLTRCCKDLGIATELWDKKWRDQWLAKYADKAWQEGKNGEKGRYVFTLKKQAGSQTLVEGRNVGVKEEPTPVPKAMTGAPSAASVAASSTTATPGTTTTMHGVPMPKNSDSSPATYDTGEVATEEQLDEVMSQIERLRWKPHYVKLWIKRTFDADGVAILTSMQAAQAVERLKVMG